MAEWSIVPCLKQGVIKVTEGSNPSLSVLPRLAKS